MRDYVLFAVRKTPEADKPEYLMSSRGPRDKSVVWTSWLAHARLFNSVQDADEYVKVTHIKDKSAVVKLSIREAYIIRAIDTSDWQGTPTRRPAVSEEEKKRQRIMDAAMRSPEADEAG